MANKTPSAKGHQWDLFSQVEVRELSSLVAVDGHNFSRPQHEVSVRANTQPSVRLQVSVLSTKPSSDGRVSKMLQCGGEGIWNLVLETPRTGAVGILPVILSKDWLSLFAQLKFLPVWNFGETEEISGLSAFVTIIFKSLFAEPYTAMLHLPGSPLATLVRPSGFQCEAMPRLSTGEGGTGDREQVQWVKPETGVQLLIPINERQQSGHLMGHQSHLNP